MGLMGETQERVRANDPRDPGPSPTSKEKSREVNLNSSKKLLNHRPELEGVGKTSGVFKRLRVLR